MIEKLAALASEIADLVIRLSQADLKIYTLTERVKELEAELVEVKKKKK